MSFQLSLLVILSLISCYFTQPYVITYSWPAGSPDCNGQYNGFVLTNRVGGCTPIACVCSPSVGCVRIVCNATSVPADPPNAVVATQYASTGCSGVITDSSSLTSGVCLASNGLLSTSYRISCVGTVYSQQQYSTGNCTGNPSSDITVNIGANTVCLNTGGSSIYYKCGDPVCFHKDSQIQYHDQVFTYDALSSEKNPSCVIPHVFTSNGVKISTTCKGVLRLTHGHLVMSNHGWRKAGLIGIGDTLYSQVHSHDEECVVTKIETEMNQEYFGLNCVDSHVLSNGYWVSTFGETHAIPSAWMKVMSKLIGVKAASQVGDKIANFAYNWAYLFN